MSGQSWVVNMLRLLISWLRQRFAALAARIESSRGRKRDAVSSTSSAQSTALTAQELNSASAPTGSTQPEETTLAARHFSSEAAATQEEAVETVAGVVSEQVDPLDLSAEDMASASTTKWPIGQDPAFTPDASLDFVEDIEFAFEPEADTEDATDASRGWVQGDGTRECPELYPIKGNGTSHIYHLPGQASYSATIPELCFATEQDAEENGFRPTKRNRVST